MEVEAGRSEQWIETYARDPIGPERRHDRFDR